MSQPTTKPELALRYNTGKPQLTQVEPGFIEGIAKVLEFGAQKYGRNNWRKGQPVTKLLDSALRHVFALVKGEDLDEESGLPHWAHACCNMMMLSAQGDREDLDDRYKKEEKKKEEKYPAKLGDGMRWESEDLENEKQFVRFGSDGTDTTFRQMKEGGKVVDKKEEENVLTRIRNSQRLILMGVDETSLEPLKIEEVTTGCDWISKDEEERMDAIREAMKAWEKEEEEEVDSIHDDLDSQNPRSPPGTPPPPPQGEEKQDLRHFEFVGGNIPSEKISDASLSKFVIDTCKPLLLG